jgi:hypothetical protein
MERQWGKELGGALIFVASLPLVFLLKALGVQLAGEVVFTPFGLVILFLLYAAVVGALSLALSRLFRVVGALCLALSRFFRAPTERR